METKILDRYEMLIQLTDEFVISRETYEEFLTEYVELISKYRV